MTEQKIYNNVRKLKNTGISIGNDLTKEEQLEQRVLYSHLKAARDKQYSAKIKNNTLIINGDTYTYEELKNSEPTKLSIRSTTQNAQRKHSNAQATPTFSGLDNQFDSGHLVGREIIQAEITTDDAEIIEEEKTEEGPLNINNIERTAKRHEGVISLQEERKRKFENRNSPSSVLNKKKKEGLRSQVSAK